MKTHKDIALYCLTHLRSEKNDGSDNLLFLGIFYNALKAGEESLNTLYETRVTKEELEQHRVKGCRANAERILTILRAGESTCSHILVEHLLDYLDEGWLTPKDIGATEKELASYKFPVT
jgi:hypothetical protein